MFHTNMAPFHVNFLNFWEDITVDSHVFLMEVMFH